MLKGKNYTKASAEQICAGNSIRKMFSYSLLHLLWVKLIHFNYSEIIVPKM
jgi:hypothetical protein